MRSNGSFASSPPISSSVSPTRYHPVFPGKPGFAARRIDDEEDVHDVIALLRLNYDRAIATHGLPQDA
jgi:hypothetical protein